MSLKRLIVSLCIVFICSITFIGGYTRTAGIVYADSTTDAWTQVTTNEQMVEAFKYYCKSRDVTINGGVADAVTHFTTKAFNGLCNTLGIDVTALQAHLKYQTDSNLGLRYLFDTEGISAYNRIFAQFLQDNDLEVGDSNVDKTVESGSWFTTADGVGCWLWTINVNSSSDTSTTNYVKGSYYLYSTSYLASISTTSWQSLGAIHFTENDTYTPNVKYTLDSGVYRYYCSFGTNTSTANLIYNPRYYPNGDGGIIIAQINFTSQSNLNGLYCLIGSVQNKLWIGDRHKLNFESEQKQNVDITIVSNTINNNTYEGDTIINNNGTTGDDDDPDPEPDTPNYNPYPDGGGGTTPPTNTGGGSGEDDGTITFPDFDFHLPEINWSLGDLSQKFPFSIPFDLIAFFTVLNAEPEAPAIDADIPLGSWYTWHFEADFSQFDRYAVIIRNVEFIGFCVGLIYLTVKLVKG